MIEKTVCVAWWWWWLWWWWWWWWWVLDTSMIHGQRNHQCDMKTLWLLWSYVAHGKSRNPQTPYASICAAKLWWYSVRRICQHFLGWSTVIATSTRFVLRQSLSNLMYTIRNACRCLRWLFRFGSWGPRAYSTTCFGFMFGIGVLMCQHQGTYWNMHVALWRVILRTTILYRMRSCRPNSICFHGNFWYAVSPRGYTVFGHGDHVELIGKMSLWVCGSRIPSAKFLGRHGWIIWKQNPETNQQTWV